MHDITIVIVARNAAQTIGRAVASAVADSDGPVLLVDDFSDDNTTDIARAAGGGQVTVVRPDAHLGVGNARQTAIDNTGTTFGIWLDADDAFMPGRTERHFHMLRQGKHDLIFDEGVLVNGQDDSIMHALTIPDFLACGGKTARQLERNWLPLTHCSFVTSFAQKVGYDPTFQASEDYDFMLRALTAGGRHGFIMEAGYRYYHYPTSLSRSLETATHFTQAAIAKHSADTINTLLENNENLSEAEQVYIKACAARSREETSLAETLLHSLLGIHVNIAPYSGSADALAHFSLGVLCLEADNAAKGETHFREAQKSWHVKEVENNLAVAMAMNGKQAAAGDMWQRLNEEHPEYMDPTNNLRAISTNTLFTYTKLPLRLLASRSMYTSCIKH